jgi:hypothetical protein
MFNRKQVIGITIDAKTKQLLDIYGENHGLSRSATIRVIVNDFFLNQEEANGK